MVDSIRNSEKQNSQRLEEIKNLFLIRNNNDSNRNNDGSNINNGNSNNNDDNSNINNDNSNSNNFYEFAYEYQYSQFNEQCLIEILDQRDKGDQSDKGDQRDKGDQGDKSSYLPDNSTDDKSNTPADEKKYINDFTSTPINNNYIQVT